MFWFFMATFAVYFKIRYGAFGKRGVAMHQAKAPRCSWWGRTTCAVGGLRVRVHGTPPAGGALVTPNHMGHLDIMALSSVVPGFFVPKADIAKWPIAGHIIRVCGHVYVDRNSKRALLAASEGIAERLRAKTNVVIFLEGTSTGGTDVLPFKPGLLQPAIDAGAPVVPVGINWSVEPGLNPQPVDVAEDVAYWRPEHSFGPHLSYVFGLHGVTADLYFGEPILIDPANPPNRQALAGLLRERVIALRAENSVTNQAVNS